MCNNNSLIVDMEARMCIVYNIYVYTYIHDDRYLMKILYVDTYDISLASRAGPISERVVNPVALDNRINKLGAC